VPSLRSLCQLDWMRELTERVDLCDAEGRLNPAAVGWSRHPLHRCNLAGAWPRKKRWNYWAFTTETHLFSVTVSNIDYVGLTFIYVADFVRGTVVEETVVTPLGLGCDLADEVDRDVHFERSGLEISMEHGDGVSGHSVRFHVAMSRFGGRGLLADLVVSYPPEHDTLNVVVSWSDKRFQFTGKHNTLPVTGTVQLGGGAGDDPEEIRFEGVQAFACLDYGRGVWPYRCSWNWGAASGKRAGRTIGLNLGGRWTDGTGSTENGVCIDGKLVKIHDDLVWSYDPQDWMKPWRIHAPDSKALDVEFTPSLERTARFDALVLRSEVHQLFGRYRGVVLDADSKGVEFDGLTGWAEEHVAAW
jgi:hypothetical protein